VVQIDLNISLSVVGSTLVVFGMNRAILLLVALMLVSSVHAATDGAIITTSTQPGPPPSSANQLSQNALDAQVSEANRYLSAEVSRQIQNSQKELIAAVNTNNDENFRVFDDRMKSYMGDLKMKVIVGGIGAILLVNALIGLAYLYVTRRYSYEHFLEKRFDQYLKAQKTSPQQKEVEDMARGLEQMQQQAWAPQAPEQSVSTMFGQAAASHMSDMNQWQFQPAYEGAWKRAEQPVSSVSWEAQQNRQEDWMPEPDQKQQQDRNQPDYVHPFEEEQSRYRTEGYNGAR